MDYYYSACVSTVEGLRAIDAGFYTWSTVKLYYAVFYACRAILAWQNVAVFRPGGRAPYQVVAMPGESPKQVQGQGSHKSMLNCFRRLNVGHFLFSQPVDPLDNIDGLEWLLRQRESANYGEARFSEPEIPAHYEQISTIGVRKAIVAYLDPAAAYLTFDMDHAIASFPLAVLRVAGDYAITNGGADMSEDEIDFLAKKCRERHGALAPLMSFIRDTLAT